MATRVGWAHDYSIENRFGGAQLTNETMIQLAPDWAEIARCYPGEVKDADLYILNNVKFFSEPELARMTAGRFVKFEHDHWDTPQFWQKEWIRTVYDGALGAIFLSPLHRDTFLDKHRVAPRAIACVPSPVNPDLFAPAEDKRGVVWLGEYAAHKGVQEACAWAKEHQQIVEFYGWGSEPPSGPFVIGGGPLPYGLIPHVLGKAQALLFLPVWHEAFGRTVAEAMFSGCEVIGNENIGALSWGLDREGLAQACREAPAKFWRTIEDWL